MNEPRHRVTLMSRQGCHLCEQARAVIEQVVAETGDAFEVLDIDADPALHERYWELIPVTLIDDRQHDYWRVDPERLRAALRA